jgi:hypothetical protein
MKNQRTTTLADGSLDPNRDFDCVAESIAAGLQYSLGRNFEGGVLKEIAYGASYQGGTAASAYVQYCAQQGVHLYPIDGSLAALTTLAHGHIRAGHPVLLTEVDPYVDTSLPEWQGATHVLVWYSESAGMLTAMDPFIDRPVERTDQGWQGVMAVNEIWVMERIGEQQAMAISLSSPGVSNFYKQGGPGEWTCTHKGNEYPVHGAILNYYRMIGGAGLCGLTVLGLPESGEMPQHLPNNPEVVEQDFERGTLRYDPHHAVENPPGSGSVYTTHRQTAPPVNAQQMTSLVAQVQSLQAKIAQVQAVLK